MNYYFDHIYNLGDIHGNWMCIPNFLIPANYDFSVKENTLICQVGDFNIGYGGIESTKRRLRELNDHLFEYNNHLFIIRGNHDDPEWFNSDKYDHIKKDYSNILFIKDYTVLNINNENWLFLGGAISVDRSMTKHMGTHFKGEEFVFDFEILSNFRDIDRVISHNAPDFCMPLYLGKTVMQYVKDDETLIDDIKNERKSLTNAFTLLSNNNKIKSWHYGHFHNSYRFYHNDCEFVCLNIDEFKEI